VPCRLRHRDRDRGRESALVTYRLTFNDAVDIWLRHWTGEYQHTIAARYDVSRGRVNDVLNERLHIGSKAVAATKRTSVA